MEIMNRLRQHQLPTPDQPSIVHFMVSKDVFKIRAASSWGRDPLLVQAKNVIPVTAISPTGPTTLSGSSTGTNSTSNLKGHSAIESLPPSLIHYYCVTKLQHKVDALRRCVHALDAKSFIPFMNHTRQLKDTVFKLEARGMTAAELHGDHQRREASTGSTVM